MLTRIFIAVLFSVAAQGALAADDYGSGDSARVTGVKADETIKVKAGDLYFSKKTIDVGPGETVRFVVTNTGSLKHEFVIGSRSEQVEHRQMMREAAAKGKSMGSMNHSDMEKGHDAGEKGVGHQDDSGMNMQTGKGQAGEDDERYGGVNKEGSNGHQGKADSHSGMNMQMGKGTGGEGRHSGSSRPGGVPTPEDMPSLTLAPGETRELVVMFPEGASNIEFACNIPGHYEAGMHGDIKIQ